MEEKKSKFEEDYEKISNIKNWVPFLIGIGILFIIFLIAMLCLLAYGLSE